MILTENKIRLTDLAHELKTTPANLRLHLNHPRTRLGEDAVKFAGRQTGDYLLAKQSVLNFLSWLKSKGRRIKIEDVLRLEEELKQL